LSAYLLDANGLIALLWPAHTQHRSAQAWFAAKSKLGWATTPFTQAAFVRIVSNPAFSKDAVAPGEAIELLQHNLQHPHHRFWPDDISVLQQYGRRLQMS
jgi:predicted nucleic acid-binding protein